MRAVARIIPRPTRASGPRDRPARPTDTVRVTARTIPGTDRGSGLVPGGGAVTGTASWAALWAALWTAPWDPLRADRP
ncbi:hypothetical protein [Nocardiopsis trehalosi]|uniref:hypothetical protein n=1 Tax=Nocardiopsis trehalosi TaxID=109329 RepID=UPI0012FCF2A6|nr:hypothetical protein [Nocardiopsis trehalosi]